MISVQIDPAPCALGNVVVGRRRYFPIDFAVSRPSPPLGTDRTPPYRVEITSVSLPSQFRLEAVFEWTANAAGTQLTSAEFDLPLNTTKNLRAWFSFRADSVPPLPPSGSIQVRLLSGTASVATTNVTLSATVVAAVPTNVVFALDRSARMNDALDAGEPRTVRMRMAASDCLALLTGADQVGAVTFNGTSVSTVSFGPLSSGPVNGFSTRRDAMENLLSLSRLHADLVPTGTCTIAGSITHCQSVLSSVADKNILVFTAGFESDIAALLALTSVGESRYVIAITEELSLKSTVIMETLVATGGRYFVAVDNPVGDAKFQLQKYACQALLETTNQQTVLDPDGALEEGESQVFEFPVTEADHRFEVFVLSPRPEALSLDVAPARDREPSKERIAAFGQRPGWRECGCGPDVESRPVQNELRGQTLLGKRITNLADDLQRRPERFSVRIEARKGGGKARAKTPFSLLVTTHSDLVLEAQLHSDGLYVGADLLLSATVLQSGRALDSVEVEVELSYPGGVAEKLVLPRTGPGRFEKALRSYRPGPYCAHFVARGRSFFGEPFRRECLRTILIFPESARLRASRSA